MTTRKSQCLIQLFKCKIGLHETDVFFKEGEEEVEEEEGN